MKISKTLFLTAAALTVLSSSARSQTADVKADPACEDSVCTSVRRITLLGGSSYSNSSTTPGSSSTTSDSPSPPSVAGGPIPTTPPQIPTPTAPVVPPAVPSAELGTMVTYPRTAATTRTYEGHTDNGARDAVMSFQGWNNEWIISLQYVYVGESQPYWLLRWKGALPCNFFTRLTINNKSVTSASASCTRYTWNVLNQPVTEFKWPAPAPILPATTNYYTIE